MKEQFSKSYATQGGADATFHFSQEQKNSLVIHKLRQFKSAFLPTRYSVDIYLPPQYSAGGKDTFPVLVFNDGQDMERVRLSDTLHNLFSTRQIPPVIVVAIHAGERLLEYGVSHQPDYKNRGSKAGLYARFIVEELVPHIHNNYPCRKEAGGMAYAGFSLGGLSAMDIGWQYSSLFGKVGVFSGSFWWRSKEFTDENPDADRIMHELIATSTYRPGMKFWLQTGTMDETSDRNNNGIIDAIDDTLDIIKELANLGYSQGEDVHYVEVEHGTHHPSTWAKVLPEFLVWAFGK